MATEMATLPDFSNLTFKRKGTKKESDKKIDGGTSAGFLYSEQATYKMNAFYELLMRTDTDETLKSVGMTRHQLKFLLNDDEIDEKIERRYENLSQSEYTLTPSEDDVATFVRDQLKIHIETLYQASMNAKYYGYSVPEFVWDKAHFDATGYLIPESFVEKPMQWFEPKNNGKLLYFPENTAVPIEVDTKYKFMLIRHKADYENPKGKAILSRVYWLWYFKKNGWQFWSKFLERFGSPILLGKTKGDTAIMATALSAAHNQSIFTMKETDSVEAINASGNGEAFKAYDNAINRRIAKYLLGQTLTSGVDTGGTAGQGIVHQEQQEIIFNSDKNFAKKYIQKFIDTLCEVNGFESPKFEFYSENKIQMELVKRDAILVRDNGVVLSGEYYSDKHDIDEKYILGVVNPLENSETKTVDKFNNFGKLKFTKGTGLTKNQELLEEHIEDSINKSNPIVKFKDLKSIIENSENEDDMKNNLFEHLLYDDKKFAESIETALLVSDIIGYCHASQDK